MDWLRDHIFEILLPALGAIIAWVTLKNKVIEVSVILREVRKDLKQIDNKVDGLELRIVKSIASHLALEEKYTRLDKEIDNQRTRYHELANTVMTLNAKIIYLERNNIK